MLKEHKNRFFDLIHEHDISLDYFDAANQGDIFRIQVRNSPIVFMLKQVPGSFDEFAYTYTLYLPNYPMKISSEEFDACKPYYNINGGIDNEFGYWLEAVVKRYIYEKEMPDLWSQARFYDSFSSGEIFEEDMRPFSPDEKVQIQIAVSEFKRLVIETYDPTQEQIKFINERLDYLVDAVD